MWARRGTGAHEASRAREQARQHTSSDPLCLSCVCPPVSGAREARRRDTTHTQRRSVEVTARSQLQTLLGCVQPLCTAAHSTHRSQHAGSRVQGPTRPRVCMYVCLDRLPLRTQHPHRGYTHDTGYGGILHTYIHTYSDTGPVPRVFRLCVGRISIIISERNLKSQTINQD